jgi:hypothetical protein
MKRFFRNVIERIKSRREGRRGTVYHIDFDVSGLTLRWLTMENEEGKSTFAWSEAISVRAFKRDLFAVDCICLQFTLVNGAVFEINEDMKGWKVLLDKLPALLPGFPPLDTWYRGVALPPFEANQTELWTRRI